MIILAIGMFIGIYLDGCLVCNWHNDNRFGDTPI